MANTKVYDGKLSTVTLNAMRLATALIMGCDVQYPQKSTLNEYYKLQTAKLPDGTERPHLQYLSIGNRGHMVDQSDVVADVVPVAKTPITSGMFSRVPLVLRTLDNDLSDEQRKQYAFRNRETINGREYWAYYLKRIDMRAVKTTDLDITRENGVEKIEDFVYTDAELNPVPKELPDYDYDDDGTVEIPDGRYVESGADLVIPWTEFDVQEYMNVTSIMRGSPRSSIISEIALSSGIDTVATGKSATGSDFSYDEAIGVQALYYISLFTNLAQTNDRLSLTIRVGQPAPFFLGTAS
ncbi:putative virion structural protein [Erwinia phage vB_EamM_Stratton]|uniref:Putative virion structural protein n=1 Tax=Erwinia phage vB_EamM_Stratton TaxID=1883378 RepID=A0A1B2IGY2_9CAUD|nr:putative virion structural protein [Erwinia phage vB_EamM_Stratton]